LDAGKIKGFTPPFLIFVLPPMLCRQAGNDCIIALFQQQATDFDVSDIFKASFT
jgi:hypothetical protein